MCLMVTMDTSGLGGSNPQPWLSSTEEEVWTSNDGTDSSSGYLRFTIFLDQRTWDFGMSNWNTLMAGGAMSCKTEVSCQKAHQCGFWRKGGRKKEGKWQEIRHDQVVQGARDTESCVLATVVYPRQKRQNQWVLQRRTYELLMWEGSPTLVQWALPSTLAFLVCSSSGLSWCHCGQGHA